MNSIIKARELIILSLSNFLKNREDFSFLGNDNKNSTVFIYDEEATSLEGKDTYPRIVLFRNASRYLNISGINDSHINHNFLTNSFTRADIFEHNFSLRVIATNFTICESLAYFISSFIRFFSKNIVSEDSKRLFHKIEHLGMSRVFKADAPNAKNALFQCDISFSIEDNEIFSFENHETGKNLNNLNIVIKTQNTSC